MLTGSGRTFVFRLRNFNLRARLRGIRKNNPIRNLQLPNNRVRLLDSKNVSLSTEGRNRPQTEKLELWTSIKSLQDI